MQVKDAPPMWGTFSTRAKVGGRTQLGFIGCLSAFGNGRLQRPSTLDSWRGYQQTAKMEVPRQVMNLVIGHEGSSFETNLWMELSGAVL